MLPAQFKIHDVFHVSLLKLAKSNGVYSPPMPVQLEGEEEGLSWEVEQVLDHKPKPRKAHQTDRAYRKQLRFLIKWTGFGPEQNTWEPLANLEGAPDRLREYWDTVELHPPISLVPTDEPPRVPPVQERRVRKARAGTD